MGLPIWVSQNKNFSYHFLVVGILPDQILETPQTIPIPEASELMTETTQSFTGKSRKLEVQTEQNFLFWDPQIGDPKEFLKKPKIILFRNAN